MRIATRTIEKLAPQLLMARVAERAPAGKLVSIEDTLGLRSTVLSIVAVAGVQGLIAREVYFAEYVEPEQSETPALAETTPPAHSVAATEAPQ